MLSKWQTHSDSFNNKKEKKRIQKKNNNKKKQQQFVVMIQKMHYFIDVFSQSRFQSNQNYVIYM